MTRRAGLLLAFAGLAHAAAAAAQDAEPAVDAPSIVTALTEEEVRISSNFTGAKIVLYGVAKGLEEGDDVVVVVRGPVRPLQVMRKSRTFGIWLNGRPARFEGAPSYYATASTRPLDLIAPPNNLQRLSIGADHAPLRAVGPRAAEFAAQIAEYRRAIVRVKESGGLYRDEPGGVDILEGGLFRAAVNVPPGSLTGRYTADAYLFRDGSALAHKSTELRVVKVGVERAIHSIAHDRPILYGFAAVCFAVVMGWGAAQVFRRR